MAPTDGRQWQFTQAYHRAGLSTSPIDYLNRASVLEGSRSWALLANSERPSSGTLLAVPMNSAVELFAAAYGLPDLAATALKWANNFAGLGDPRSLAPLANTARPANTAQAGLPTNEVVAPERRVEGRP